MDNKELSIKSINKQNFLQTITIIFCNYSLLLNITDNKRGLLWNVTVFCGNLCMLSLSVTSIC